MSGEHGEPLFCGKDVAEALGYGNPQKAIRDHVFLEDKGVNEMGTPGGTQKAIFINESGLYSLILGSKLESARKFKRWVTSEVLPSIRKHGGYMVAKADESDEEIMARALKIAHATLQRRGLE
jgi:prophage antirepressor-like protein